MPPRSPDESRTIEQYRAFCLLALGRSAEAEHAIAAVDNVNRVVETNSPSVAYAVSNVVQFSKEINDFAKSTY